MGGPDPAFALFMYATFGVVVVLADRIARMSSGASTHVQDAVHTEARSACVLPPRETQELDPEPPEVARSLHPLGRYYSRRADFAMAEPFYVRALAIQEVSLGANAPELAMTLNDYAALLRQIGRTRQAWDLERRAEEIHRVNP